MQIIDALDSLWLLGLQEDVLAALLVPRSVRLGIEGLLRSREVPASVDSSLVDVC